MCYFRLFMCMMILCQKSIAACRAAGNKTSFMVQKEQLDAKTLSMSSIQPFMVIPSGGHHLLPVCMIKIQSMDTCLQTVPYLISWKDCLAGYIEMLVRMGNSCAAPSMDADTCSNSSTIRLRPPPASPFAFAPAPTHECSRLEFVNLPTNAKLGHA